MADATTTNQVTNDLLNLPDGSARTRVRGLAASMVASTSRLKAMAAERAATNATMIQIDVCRLGMPRAASTAPVKPNGSVSTECSHLIISDRKSTRLNSSHLGISYAVFCLKK